MVFKLSTSPLKLYHKNFLLLSSDPRSSSNAMWCIKFPVLTVTGAILEKQAVVWKLEKKEHIKNVKTFAGGSSIAKHAWSFNHNIDFNNSTVIDKGFRILAYCRFQ